MPLSFACFFFHLDCPGGCYSRSVPFLWSISFPADCRATSKTGPEATRELGPLLSHRASPMPPPARLLSRFQLWCSAQGPGVANPSDRSADPCTQCCRLGPVLYSPALGALPIWRASTAVIRVAGSPYARPRRNSFLDGLEVWQNERHPMTVWLRGALYLSFYAS